MYNKVWEGLGAPESPCTYSLGAYGHLVTNSYATTLLLEIFPSFLLLSPEKLAALTLKKPQSLISVQMYLWLGEMTFS